MFEPALDASELGAMNKLKGDSMIEVCLSVSSHFVSMTSREYTLQLIRLGQLKTQLKMATDAFVNKR